MTTTNSSVRAVPLPAAGGDLVALAEDLLPLLQRNAAENERTRRVADENLEALRDAGILNMNTPREFGGLETDLPTQVEVLRTLGRGCASTAWLAGVHTQCCYLLSMFPLEVQEQIFSDPGCFLSGIFSPTVGMKPLADGGLVLNGAMPFNSGCLHSTWNIVTTSAPSGDGNYLSIVPTADCEIKDDWHVSGLRGTGSNTSVVKDLHVPSQRTIPMGPMLQGVRPEGRADRTPFKYPAAPMLVTGPAAPVLGMAEGLMDNFLDRLPGRRLSFESGHPQNSSSLTQLAVAEAKMKLETAKLFMRHSSNLIHTRAVNNEELSMDERILARTTASYVVKMARDVGETLNAISGGTSVYVDLPINRFHRDLVSASKHAFFNYEWNMAVLGRSMLGVETEALLV